jgi:hypothetical protein
MALKTVWFLSLFFVALALAPAMAHLLALPNKINMPREQYLIVQQTPENFRSHVEYFPLHGGNTSAVLDLHIPSQPANAQLDRVARELAGASTAVGVLSCCERRSKPCGVRCTNSRSAFER